MSETNSKPVFIKVEVKDVATNVTQHGLSPEENKTKDIFFSAYTHPPRELTRVRRKIDLYLMPWVTLYA
jgi:hypothetical protein